MPACPCCCARHGGASHQHRSIWEKAGGAHKGWGQGNKYKNDRHNAERGVGKAAWEKGGVLHRRQQQAAVGCMCFESVCEAPQGGGKQAPAGRRRQRWSEGGPLVAAQGGEGLLAYKRCAELLARSYKALCRQMGGVSNKLGRRQKKWDKAGSDKRVRGGRGQGHGAQQIV
jgi:hypothetical protein